MMRPSRFTVIGLGGGVQSSVWVEGHCGGLSATD